MPVDLPFERQGELAPVVAFAAAFGASDGGNKRDIRSHQFVQPPKATFTASPDSRRLDLGIEQQAPTIIRSELGSGTSRLGSPKSNVWKSAYARAAPLP
jgi:hypothetical protein